MAYFITCVLSLSALLCGVLSPTAYLIITPVTLVAVCFLVLAPLFGKTLTKRTTFWLRVVAVFHFSMCFGHNYAVGHNGLAFAMVLCGFFWMFMAMNLAEEMDGLNDNTPFEG